MNINIFAIDSEYRLYWIKNNSSESIKKKKIDIPIGGEPNYKFC